MGYIAPELTRKFPDYLPPSPYPKSADVPNGLAAISKVPAAGWVQFCLYGGFCEHTQDRSPGAAPAMCDHGLHHTGADGEVPGPPAAFAEPGARLRSPRASRDPQGAGCPELTVKFPDCLPPSPSLKFTGVPNGLAAISQVPTAGWVQSPSAAVEARLRGLPPPGPRRRLFNH